MSNQQKCSGYGLVELLKDKGNVTGVEIGCAEGDTSDWLLKSLPNIHWIGIDPYIDYVDWNSNFLQNLENRYQQFSQRVLTPYSNRTTFYRTTSDEALVNFSDESLDFIFIDGIHTYDQVLKDCINYYPKIKKGGLFAGHDYGVIKEVAQAVDTFRNKHCPDKTILLTDVDVWYWWK